MTLDQSRPPPRREACAAASSLLPFVRHPRQRFARALFAGMGATIADLATLVVLVSLLGLSPKGANVPALIVGGAVSFFANRHWVFRASGGSLPLQALSYVLVEIGAL